MGVLEIIGTLFLLVGCVFSLTGSIGVLRFPDFYSRLHPAGKTDALAQVLILFGLALFAGQQLLEFALAEDGDHTMAMIGEANIMLKLGLIAVILLVTAPTSTHAISKAARLDRYTRIQVEEMPGAARIEDIVVAGDVRDNMQEEAHAALDVRDKPEEPETIGQTSPDTQSEDD
jgi:multicomponent Na+:H+ antiporter subunit G